MKNIDSQNFDLETEVLKAEKPVVIYFWASWCQPCKAFSPIFEAMEDTYPNIDFAKCQADDGENADIANDLNVKSVPKVLAFKNGQIYILEDKPSMVALERFLENVLTL